MLDFMPKLFWAQALILTFPQAKLTYVFSSPQDRQPLARAEGPGREAWSPGIYRAAAAGEGRVGS